MTKISKAYCIVTFAGSAVLFAGCATDPRPPSLPSPQFIVLVKGESGPLKAFETFIAAQLSASLKDCTRMLPESGREAMPKSDEPRELAYKCAPADKRVGNAQLAVFAEAYTNSIASLLEMKVTTTGGCKFMSCWGGLPRNWYVTPYCRDLC